MRKTTRFRELLESSELECILEAHNGLSARICEEEGFPGIWASGLCLSAQFGVRDSNEASWTQVLEMLEFMSDAADIPILLDGDTGYGNFNNVRRLVTKLEQRGIAAVCIEDKLFPKTNSFLKGESQELAGIDEFCGKIRAGKDAQKDDDFCIVARTEALIAGQGMNEALRRAEAYTEAGADAILIHSSSTSADEVLAFRAEWGDRSPVVIVPTRYWETPTEVFREAGFSMAIWANHMLRSALVSMQRTARRLRKEGSLAAIEQTVAPLSEVFRLQRTDELQRAEARFLPQTASRGRAIVLAASRGSELGELTAERPKTMVPIEGEPLLAHIASAYARAGIKRLTVVRGYRKDAVALDVPRTSVRWVDNDDYETTGELYSLSRALADLDTDDDLYVSYGDVLFHRGVVDQLGATEGDVVIPVDVQWKRSSNLGRHIDFVACSARPARGVFKRNVDLARVASDLPEAERDGEWMGIVLVRRAALGTLRDTAANLLEREGDREPDMPRLLNALVEAGRSVRVVYTTGSWLDVDELRDLIDAGTFH